MLEEKIKNVYKGFCLSLEQSMLLSENLGGLIENQISYDSDIVDKNLFYLDIIYQHLKEAQEQCKKIVVNCDYIKNLQAGKIIDLLDYSLYKQCFGENDTVYVDFNNPISIFTRQFDD